MLDSLFDLKKQIEADLKVATAPEDNKYHLDALDAVDNLISYLL